MTALLSKVPATVTVLLGYFNQIATSTLEQGLTIQVIDSAEIEYVSDNMLQFTGVLNHRQQPISLGNLRREETFDLSCLIRCFSGDTDQSPTVRANAYQMLQQLVVAVTGDYTAGGNLRFWQLSDVSELAGPDTVGWSIELTFSVHGEVALEQ